MRIIVFILCIFATVNAKILTSHLGSCNDSRKIENGYIKCHDIKVKYNLEKGRISTDGALADSDLVFMIRFWDKDSMRIDFTAMDLHVNKAYADSEYIVPKEIINDTKYIEILPYQNNENFSAYNEEIICFNDNVVWHKTISDKTGTFLSFFDICLPPDSVLNNYIFEKDYDFEIKVKAIYRNKDNIITSSIIDTVLVDSSYSQTPKKLRLEILKEEDHIYGNYLKGIITKRYYEDNKAINRITEYICEENYEWDYSINECYKKDLK